MPEGTVILAEEQYAGRGQQGNKWLSQAGKNLTCSILLNPVFLEASRQFLLNQAVSVAINQTLSGITGKPFSIKWPNDIYFGGRKAGGILIENSLNGSTLKHAIIGIGINVNQDEFPADLSNATSLKKILQSDYGLNILLSQLCSYIEAWYLRLRAGHTQEIVREYREKLFQLNETKQYRLADGSTISGIIRGVAPAGQLELEMSGRTDLFSLKEIAFL